MSKGGFHVSRSHSKDIAIENVGLRGERSH